MEKGMGLTFTVLNPAWSMASRSRDKFRKVSPVGNQLITISAGFVPSSVRPSWTEGVSFAYTCIVCHGHFVHGPYFRDVNAEGEIPNCLRKAWAKWLELQNPASKAVSVILNLFSESSILA